MSRPAIIFLELIGGFVMIYNLAYMVNGYFNFDHTFFFLIGAGMLYAGYRGHRKRFGNGRQAQG